MLELGIGADIVRGIGWVFTLAFFAALALALWRGKTRRRKLINVGLVLLVFIGPALPGMYRSFETKQKYANAKALFDERCKTAGEKIYQTVDNVEGVLLLNVRPGVENILANEANPNWLDAGLPNERGGEEYIASFLMWEQHQDKRNPRGGLNYAPSDLPGYRYVDVKSDDSTIYRYTLAEPGNPDSAKLSKSILKGKPAQYAVSFVNIRNEADRQHWVAGTTVTVTDTQSAEVLAESTWYAIEPGQGSRAGTRQPWRFALSCPDIRGSRERTPTRFFVDQVLKPKKGE
jgi:hypothetical protein